MRALDEDLRSGIIVGLTNQPLVMTALLRLWPGLRLYDLLVKVSKLEWVFGGSTTTWRAHLVLRCELGFTRYGVPYFLFVYPKEGPSSFE